MSDDGGPAFPVEDPYAEGMSLRDYFAAKAMAGLLASLHDGDWDWDTVAGFAYKQADAMLVARHRRPEE